MRYASRYLFCIILLLSARVFALPCATTGKITYRDESIEKVLSDCGAPLEKKSYTKEIITAQRLVFYKNIAGQNQKLSITLNNNQVSNIEVGKDNVSSTNICGTAIKVNDDMQSVISSCGNPNYTKTLNSIRIEVIEMKYSTISPQIWVFENGKLVDWK
jgi:hypothetical protein